MNSNEQAGAGFDAVAYADRYIAKHGTTGTIVIAGFSRIELERLSAEFESRGWSIEWDRSRSYICVTPNKKTGNEGQVGSSE